MQQLVTATLSPLDDQTLHTLLQALAAASDAIEAAPGDLPPPAARRTPPGLRRG